MKFHKLMRLGRAVGDNEIAKVEALCKEALEHDPEDIFALGVLADTYWRNERHEAALSIALRSLEITPNDFDALRIAAYAQIALGSNEAVYQYAKRLSTAVPYVLEPHDEAAALLKPLSWIPGIRLLRQKTLSDKNTQHSSRADWTQWAQDYVTWYESQSITSQENGASGSS